MKELYKDQLFMKHILVNETQCLENTFEALFSLANLLNIKITKGAELANLEILKFASKKLGQNVPEPFYRGFPESVRELTQEQLIFDQMVHYILTYGFGDFSTPAQSLFKENFEKTAFKEITKTKEFIIINKKDAIKELETIVENLLSSSRPLNEQQYLLVKTFIEDFDYIAPKSNCKVTTIRLLLDTQNLKYVNHLHLSDVINVVEQINYQNYKGRNIKKLNLNNQDRKFISKVIDIAVENHFNIADCYEKQALWCGILHHIHYKPKTAAAVDFVNSMRNSSNNSVYSHFEKAMQKSDIKTATDILLKNKGQATVLRNLNYLVSRCNTDDDLNYVINSIDTKNNIVLIQNILNYSNYKNAGARNFKFTRLNRLKVHIETPAETTKRKSVISRRDCNKICDILNNNLQENLKNKLGKVYIDDAMSNIALPIQENTSMSGYGTLPKGSRIDIPDIKKIRAFVYWEKVHDIDLSAIGLTENLKQTEFSWRNMATKQSDALTFSGDITSGYNGASEYFDIDLEKVRNLFPDMKYLILNANVFSCIPFCNCICQAGYMQRDIVHSGEIFEPKTVESSFQINSDSTYAHLFAIDLTKNQIIWLNLSRNQNSTVAGTTNLSYLLDYMTICETFNVKKIFTLMATQVVDDPKDADVIVTDKNISPTEQQTIIRSYDTDKMLNILNSK